MTGKGQGAGPLPIRLPLLPDEREFFQGMVSGRDFFHDDVDLGDLGGEGCL